MNTEVKDVPTSRGPQAAARLPEQTHVGAVHLRASGYVVDDAPDGVRSADPWGTRVYVRSEEGE